MSRMWKSTGKRQADNVLNGDVRDATGKRHRLTDRVRIMAGSVKWSYLEMEDHLKCRFWKLFSGSRAKCTNKECSTCNARVPGDVPQQQQQQHRADGRLSALLQKIRTWPKFGSRRIRDHMTAQDKQSDSFGPTPQTVDRLKAASFPVKHKDLSRARFLPRFRNFESIREESVQPPPKESDVLYMNVVGLEIAAAQDAVATPSVEDLSKYSYSFGSDSLSFGTRDDSMAKDAPAQDTTLPGHVAAIAEAPAVSSEVSESAGPGPHDHTAWIPANEEVPQPARQMQQGESPTPKPCAAALQGDAVPQSRFSGVRWKAKKWTSEIRPTGAKKTVWLGTYRTEEEAASAYDAGIFYFDKSKDYNFEDSEMSLPMLDRTLDERAQLHFIKTQARLIAKRRAAIMSQEARSSFQPGTPDTSSSAAASSSGAPSRSRVFYVPSYPGAD